MRSFLILFTAAAVAIPAGAFAQERRDEHYNHEQNEGAVRACREAVRQQAYNRFGGNDVQFRELRVDPDGDDVVGAIDIPRGNFADRYRFTCSMDFDRDEVRSVRIIPMNEGGPGVGYRERSADGQDRAVDNCRNAVAGRITGQGYRRVQFDSLRFDPDGDQVVGVARARRGDDFDAFNFACRVEPRDGDLRSVNVTRR